MSDPAVHQVLAEAGAEPRGVVAGTGADFQDVTGADFQDAAAVFTDPLALGVIRSRCRSVSSLTGAVTASLLHRPLLVQPCDAHNFPSRKR
jgi:hypothetical protein